MNEEIRVLRSELALLKLQFSERVNQVEARLNNLLEQENLAVDDTNSAVQSDQSQAPAYPDQHYQVAGVSGVTSAAISESASVSNRQSQVAAPKKPKYVHKPSPIAVFIESNIKAFIQAILGFIFDWFTPAVNIYKSYKEKGMLGIFVLTIAGIALVLAGFGYLMQLLIDQLGVGSKSLLMCLAALLVMSFGIGLKIKTQFSEFATAIITLGVLLSYCTVYFAGSVYGIIPSALVLISYFIIALGCHGIAHWFDTKIVASLGVIGIATMPILSNTVQIEPLYYLLSLSFVVISSLYFAFKTNEKWLATLTLVFTFASIEWVIGFENVQLSVWAVNLFYIIFFTYAALGFFFNKNLTNSLFTDTEESAKESTDNTENTAEANEKTDSKSHTNNPAGLFKSGLLFIAALVGSTVFIFFQASDLFSTQMTLCFTFNTLLSVAVAILFYKVKHEITPFIILLSALWGMLAIISVVSNAYWGISWAVEGLLLLYVGRKYLLNVVSNQAQALLTIALVYSWAAIAQYFPLPALQTLDGWVLSVAIVLIIGIWQRMITPKGFDEFSQQYIKPFLQLVEVVWISVLVIASSSIWLGEWTGVAAIVLQACILFRARYCKEMTIEIFAALLIVIPVFYIFQGAMLIDPYINSYRFSALPLFAKLAAISVFAQLWLWSAFYRKYHPTSPLKNIAETLRILFYLLLPILWLSSAFRKLEEDLLMVLWLSPAIALFLAQKIKHHLLVKEAKVLTVIASIIFMLGIGQLSLLSATLAFLGFTVLYGASYLINKKSASDLYQFISSWGLFALGIAISNALIFYADSLFIGLMAGIVYWSGCLALMNRVQLITRNLLLVYIVNILLVVAGWILTDLSSEFIIIPMLFIAALIYQKHEFAKLAFINKFTQVNSYLFIHSLAIITYLTLFSTLSGYRLPLLIAPALAIHGAIILFMKNRHITTIRYSFALILLGIAKLALIDAAHALLWQKVILFMGIGAFILAASFWYQKLVNKMKIESTLNDENEQQFEEDQNQSPVSKGWNVE
ncbi:DUF2339 domain-containing protein [Pseudocolwellia sp. HL-MZ7]|uniref:DUF2339 domain-containing protein n=1 Tax=Pseudocolwellia sp. HL-MZ7 TaxID=3400627 RepID=UPI003CF5FC1A